MDIVYSQNPSYSVYILDDREKEILGLRLELEDYIDRICMADYSLGTCRPESDVTIQIDIAKSYLGYDESKDDLHEPGHYIKKAEHWLVDAELHEGDCVCISGPCVKCHIDRLLGIDTTHGFRKHDFYYIRCLYKHLGVDATCEQALQHIRNVNDKVELDYSRCIDTLEAYKREYVDTGKVGGIKAWPV
jgi:hypothetical protein